MNNPLEWQQRWQQQKIGWHQNKVSPLLIQYFEQLKLPKKAVIFAPLCGKSIDMLWLVQQGYQVIGVEISELAIQTFFEEANIISEKRNISELTCWQAENIQIYQADFFDLTKQHLKQVQAVFDRAALVALPNSEQRGRKDYITHLQNELPKQTKTLLVTLDYDQNLMAGPPFAVSNQEVDQLFKFSEQILTLSEEEIIEQEIGFKDRGLDSLTERLYLID